MHIRKWRVEGALFAIAVLLAATAVISAVVSGRHVKNADQVWMEYLRASLQVVLVIVLGTAAKLLGDGYQSKRNQAREAQEFRREVLKDLINAYSQVKQSRRLLRANGCLDTPLKNSRAMRDFYDCQMVLISKSQLGLETIIRQIETGSAPFSNRDELLKRLGSMEQYLGKIVTEYESNMPAIRRISDNEPWPPMTRLEDLVLPAKMGRGGFLDYFADPYKLALQSIRLDLLG